MINSKGMIDLALFNFYLLLIISFFSLVVMLFILKKIKANKTISNDFYFGLLRASLPILILTSITAILSAFTEVGLIFSVGILIGIAIFFMRSKTSFTQYVKWVLEVDKKDRENSSYIASLKNRPADELKKAQSLLQTSCMFLNRMSNLIVGKKDVLGDMYTDIAKAFMLELSADGAVVLMADSIEETISVKALVGKFPPPYKLPDDVVHKEEHVNSNFKYAEFTLSDSIFGKILTQAEMKLIKPSDVKDVLPDNGAEPFLQHGSLIFFPLVVNNMGLGIVAVSRSTNNKPFEYFDARSGENLAAYTSEMINLGITLNEATESAEIQNITETVAEIQRILLPKKLKNIPLLDIGEYFVQARGICSDYYDVITVGNKTFIVVADVAGKSVQSAIVMVMLRAILYLIINNTNLNITSILDMINKGITGKIGIDHFASISILCYEAGKNSFKFIGAGNQAMMVLRNETKKIELFQQNTDPIGVDLNSSYTQTTIPIFKGDTVALYTDGLIEALDKNGEQYGTRRLAQVLVSSANLKSKDIATKIKSNVTDFISKTVLHDDQTLLIIKMR